MICVKDPYSLWFSLDQCQMIGITNKRERLKDNRMDEKKATED